MPGTPGVGWEILNIKYWFEIGGYGIFNLYMNPFCFLCSYLAPPFAWSLPWCKYTLSVWHRWPLLRVGLDVSTDSLSLASFCLALTQILLDFFRSWWSAGPLPTNLLAYTAVHLIPFTLAGLIFVFSFFTLFYCTDCRNPGHFQTQQDYCSSASKWIIPKSCQPCCVI